MREPLWRLIVSAETAVVRLPSVDIGRWRRLADHVRALPSGSPVALLDGSPLARLRSRCFAAQARLRVHREYIALPSLGSALCLVEDAAEPIRYLEANLITVPPASSFGSRLGGVCVSWGARWLPWQVVGGLVPGRVALGWTA